MEMDAVSKMEQEKVRSVRRFQGQAPLDAIPMNPQKQPAKLKAICEAWNIQLY